MYTNQLEKNLACQASPRRTHPWKWQEALQTDYQLITRMTLAHIDSFIKLSAICQ